MEERFYVQPPTGSAKSGKFCWWVVKDREVDLRKHGNNVIDYFYDGYPDAKERAEARARELNAAAAVGTICYRFGMNHPDTTTEEGMAEFMALYHAAPEPVAA